MIIKNALISLYNKNGIEVIMEALKQFNVTVYATESTEKYLSRIGYNVKKTEEITGISSLLGGRVKTLNEKLFSGILSYRNEMDKDSIPVLFDLVVSDLYPFADTVKTTCDHDEIIEKIDIGGVSLIRAAAKNHKYVGIICRKDQYNDAAKHIIMNKGSITDDMKREWAGEAFAFTMAYDSEINDYFRNTNANEEKKSRAIILNESIKLRYGENPHQEAKIYRISNSDESIMDFAIHHGKAMSYNNFYDLDAALNIISLYNEPAVTIVKHANPCGIGTGETINEAYELAYMSDPMSSFGGIVAMNRECNEETAEMINSSFIEIVCASSYEENAIKILSRKKNIRIIEGNYKNSNNMNYKHLNGSMLVQVKDNMNDNENIFSVISKRQPSEREWKAMKFAWRAVRYIKSNAIVITSDQRTLGIGAGQMSRVDAVDIAIKKCGVISSYTGGTALASDGFFPFRDSIDKASKAGITAIIEPGGSKNDLEIIQACDEYNMALVFTGKRHFLH